MKLKGKTAVLTGASDGIGREIALKLANEGVSLALISRSEDKLNEVKAECEKIGSEKVVVYPCDLRVKQEIKDTVGKLLIDFPSVNILINNAGVWQKLRPLDEVSLDEADELIDVNLTAPVFLTSLILPSLRKGEDAAIINISSHSGVGAKAGQSVYAAAKWGVRGLTEVLREDLKGTSVHVAGVYQGGVRTKLFEKVNDPKDPESFETYTEPTDLADVIVFMLSRPPKLWLHEVRVDRF